MLLIRTRRPKLKLRKLIAHIAENNIEERGVGKRYLVSARGGSVNDGLTGSRIMASC